MKRYQSPLFLARLLRIRYSHLHISQHNNVISLSRVAPTVYVGFIPYLLHAGHSLGSRQYSNDRRSYYGGVVDSKTPEGFHQLDNSCQHFQQWSNSGNHNPVDQGTNRQHLTHDYVDKGSQQNLGFEATKTDTGFHQVNGHWSQRYPSNTFTVNAEGDQSGGYQQQNSSVQPSLNAYNSTYQAAASTGGVVESALKELNDLCKEWDLLKAVECMKQLSTRGVGIDLPRYFTLIEACGEAKALEEAKAVHEHLLKFFSLVSTSTFNRILDMYGKCGSMNDAYDTFNNMPERNLTSWDKMLSWYAKNGLGEEAIDMFTKFKEAGLKPDGQMFFGLFDACGVVGDVTEGMLHFDSMSKTYGITPTMDHYASVVRMFGSAGDLDGALDFIEKMPVDPNVDVWESLMNISRVQGNVELGDRCAQVVNQLDASRLTNESKTGLVPIKNHGILKKKVKKAILSESRQHEYRAGDRSHPETEKIYALLRGFRESMKEAGYVPETRFVLHDIDQEEKEEAIMAHSERLAAANFLLTSTPRTPMRIIKNLRVCGDCHNVFKIISKLVGRKIIMRDNKRFHHFDDGKCTCNDYW